MNQDESMMLWGWKTVYETLTARHGYQYTLGQWHEVPPAEFSVGSPCPSFDGDGLCIAKTFAGAAEGSRNCNHVLLCGYYREDVLGEDSDKVRVKRLYVHNYTLNVNQLIRTSGRGADLHWADLSWADLRRAHLSGANLSWADLHWADLREADLSGAKLRGADLRWANLRWADLREADLSGADLSWAKLRWADLSGVDLSGADVSGADVSWANLRWAKLSEARGVTE